MSKPEILIIDDDEFVAESVSAILHELGFNNVYFNSPERGIAYFNAEKSPIIFLDINLPKVNGLDVLKEIKNINPLTQVIMMTGEREIQNVIASIKHRASDFLLKPFSVQTVDIAVQRAYEHYKIVNEKEIYQKAIETDLKLAAKVQKKLMTPSLQKKNIYTDLHALHFVSGDFYQVLKIDNSKYFLFIGDLEGHGISSGLVSLFVISIIKEVVRIHPNPSFILSRINDELFKEIPTHAMTAVSILVDEDKKKIKYSKAAHPSPILFRSEKKQIKYLYDKAGENLALLPDVKYEIFEESYEVGDVLLLYSDGLFSCKGIEIKEKQKEFIQRVTSMMDSSTSVFETVKQIIQVQKEECIKRDCFQDDMSFVLYQL